MLYKRLFLAAGALTALLACPSGEPKPSIPRGRLGEALGLMIFSVTGMCVLVSSRELALLYTGLELVTMPLVALVAFHPREPRGAEAGLKYVFTSALSSGFLLYGLSFVYGLTGTTMIAEVAERLPAGPLTLAALVMVMVGVGFKISAVPFHLWAPDVYEGGPVVVSAFLAVASKAAGFALFAKVVGVAFARVGDSVALLVALLAVVTMTVGNLVALHQTNIKRFLAYSSIAQAGYLLIGLAPGGYRADASVAFYLLVYLVSCLAAFGVAAIVAGATGREDMREYIGLSESNPRLAFVMMLSLFSLSGIPPLAGFLGKFYLFAAAAAEGDGLARARRRRQLHDLALLLPDGDPLDVHREADPGAVGGPADPHLELRRRGPRDLHGRDAGARPAAADPALGRVRRRRRILIPGSAGRAFLAPAALRFLATLVRRAPARLRAGSSLPCRDKKCRSRPTRDRYCWARKRRGRSEGSRCKATRRRRLESPRSGRCAAAWPRAVTR